MCIKIFLKLSGNPDHFIKSRCNTKEHRTEHLLIVSTPIEEVGFRWCQAKGAWLVGGVVHPRVAGEDFSMLGDTLKKSLVFQGAFSNAGIEETPQVVIVASLANLSRLVSRTECFLVE